MNKPRVIFKPEYITTIKGRWCMEVETKHDRDGIMKILKGLGFTFGFMGYVNLLHFCLHIEYGESPIFRPQRDLQNKIRH